LPIPKFKCKSCDKEFGSYHPKAVFCSRKCCVDYRKISHGQQALCHPERRLYSTGLCQSCYHKKYRTTNKGWITNSKRIGRLTRVYGVTTAQWLKMFEIQAGLCPICGNKLYKPGNLEGKRAANVDHDHKTKRVRGLVCNICNRLRIGINTADTAARLAPYLASDFDGRNI